VLLVGNFREDEVLEDGFLKKKIRHLESFAGSINVIRLFIGELPERDINKMLSFKFCLPSHHTRKLAQLVYQKTRGHPLFVTAFLRSMIKGHIITFSVKARQWMWDDTTIELQMISEDVAEFMTKRLKQHPGVVIEALKVVSCFGQVNISTIQLLDLGQFVPNMLEALEVAETEGLLDRAGPVFAFSHDMLQESTYNLIQKDERKQLHKKVGMSLVQDMEDIADNADVCILAVDQINICKDLGGILRPAECFLFARLNLAAGKHFMSAEKSNYEQGELPYILRQCGI